MFDTFTQDCLLMLDTKEKQAEAIMWFHLKETGISEITLATINQYFEKASLPKLNVTRAKAAFTKNKNVHKGIKPGTYKLSLPSINMHEEAYGYLWKRTPKFEDIANIFETPYLSGTDISQAQKMAELYVILNCYENSARALVTYVLQKKYGDGWWELSASAPQKNKVKSRKESEAKHQWLTPRGGNPLYYIDWGDLLSIIRKYETDFLPYIKELKFVELRFEELERIRNITAHNGFLPNEEDFQRVVLSFKDWCRQTKMTTNE